MKIAVLISGFLRTFLHNFKNNVELFKNYDCDYYLHLSRNEEQDRYTNDKCTLNDILEIIEPRCILMEKEIVVKDCENLRRMWYKIYILNELRKNNEKINNFKYDIVIRIRPDLYILDKKIDFIVSDNIIYGRKFNDILLDEFNYGNSEAMDNYASLYLYIDKYLENNKIHRPEELLKAHCDNLKLQLEDSNISHKLVLSLCNIIGLTGDSGSGKTNLMKNLEYLFNNNVLKLECDRYHKWERGDKNWENYTHLNPDANYITKFTDDVYNLKIGNDIYQVDYDHSSGKFTPVEKIKNENNIILCGLHTLLDKDLNNIINFKIYLDTDEKLRRYWKIRRDVIERGYDINKVVENMDKRIEDFDRFIRPQMENADMVIRFFTDDNFNYLSDINPNIYLSITISNRYNFIEIIELLNNADIEYEIIVNNSRKKITFYKIQENFNKLFLNLIEKYIDKDINLNKELSSFYTIINCFLVYLIKKK